jgi:hypothetical protein
MIKRPLAWIPVAMSLAILAMVLTTIGISGAVRQEDEGTQAHIFQIWLVLEVVLVTAFVVACMGASETEAGTHRSSDSDPWRTCGLRSGFLFQAVALGTQHKRLSVVAPSLVSELALALPCRPANRSLVADPPVHGGYTRSRQVEERNGHERSPRELRNRRSAHQRSRHQAPLQEAGRSSRRLSQVP